MKKRGASLIWALVMSASLLFIAVTMASFVIRESQMSVRMDESSRAYAAAESGIEWGKYCVESLTLCDNSYQSPVFNLGGSQYTVKITVGPQTIIESLGTSNGVNRKLEYIINPGNVLQEVQEVPDLTLLTFTTSGSYVQQFDYWIENSGSANIGFGNSNGSKSIYFKHIGEEISLEAKNGTDIRFSQKLSTASLGITDVYAIQVRIEYFKDLSAKMTVSKRTFGGASGLACVSPTLVLDLRNFGIGSSDFTKLYFSPVTAVRIGNPVGNGFVYTIPQGTNIAYFDNMATIGMIHPIPPKTYTLTVQVQEGVNWGRVTAAGTTLSCGNGGLICSVSVEENKEIILTAVGQSSHTFNSWTGLSGSLCADTKSTSCVIAEGKITSNIDITALFNR